MPRILGIDIPANKRIDIALRSLYGIGPATSAKVLENAKIDPATRAHTLSEDELATIAKAIQTTEMRPEQTRTDNCVILVEGDLRRKVTEDLKRHKNIKTYRGLRHARSARARATHPNQRPYPQGVEEDRRRPEQESLILYLNNHHG